MEWVKDQEITADFVISKPMKAIIVGGVSILALILLSSAFRKI